MNLLLSPKGGSLNPAPLHWISKETMEVVVFHRRRSSHLFYTLHVSSQCQTRVKLNHFYQPFVASISSCDSKFGPNYLCGTSAPVIRQLSLWISTSLKQSLSRLPTPYRALRRPLLNHSSSARHGIAIVFRP